MTKRDYVLLSGALRKENPPFSGVPDVTDVERRWSNAGFRCAAYAICEALAAANPRFDSKRFLTDAGIAR